MITLANGHLWSEPILGRARAERLNHALDTLCQRGDAEPERIFEGAHTLAEYRAAAEWAVTEWGADYQPLVESLTTEEPQP